MLWYSLEAPYQYIKNPQYMFSWRNKKNIMCIPPLICAMLVTLSGVIAILHIRSLIWIFPTQFTAQEKRGIKILSFCLFLHKTYVVSTHFRITFHVL